MITMTASGPAQAKLGALRAGLAPERVHMVVKKVAFKTLASVVRATPKRWFGALRRAWSVVAKGVGDFAVVNASKVMRFLEYGTANAGTGYIYPVRKKALYLPLNRKAAMGWRPSLKRGQDYLLRGRVRGIKPRGIVAAERKKAEKLMLEEMKSYIRGLIGGQVR